MPLSALDYDLFMDTYLPLLHYTGRQHGIISSKTTYRSFVKKLDFTEKFECRQKLIQDKDIIRQYISKFGARLSVEELHILAGLSKRVTGKFIIYKLLTHGAVFIGPQEIFYIVHDLSDPFSTLIDDGLPCIVEASIVPFQSRIVYDGFLQPYAVHFGPGIRKNLRDQYKIAREEGRIVKLLK